MRQSEKHIVKQYELCWADLPVPAGRRPVLLLSRGAAYRRDDRTSHLLQLRLRHFAADVLLQLGAPLQSRQTRNRAPHSQPERSGNPLVNPD